MGYELNKLMKQLGVSTPTMAAYTGATAPTTPPVATATQADKDAFTEQTRKYNLDQNVYNQYKQQYQDRLQTGSQYGPPTTAAKIVNPTYGAVGLNMQGMSDADRQAYYNSQRKLGYTMGDLKANAEKTFGVGSVADPNWNGWERQYNPNYVPPAGPIVATGYTPPVTTTTTTGTYNAPDTFNGSYDSQYFDPNNPNWAYTGQYFDPNDQNNPYYHNARGGSIHALAAKYRNGGPVKTHYDDGGNVDFGNDNPVNFTPSFSQPNTPVMMMPPPARPPAASGLSDDRMAGLQKLLEAYGPKENAYTADLAKARESAKTESDAFAKMLTGAMQSPEDAQSSKAEMYFRLAAAFGAPTKTGQFSENLGLVGKELGDYAKNKRADAQQKLALAMKGQELKMGAAKEDLRSLQTLSSEDMRDKRAITSELLKEYIRSGEPQSTAGKQASDEGLKPGTPEYRARVAQLGDANIEAKLAQITASLANVKTAAENLGLRQDVFNNQQAQQKRLTPTELKLKSETEDVIASGNAGMAAIKRAYALNPNTFDASLVDAGQRKMLELGGSKDPKLLATREQENLLTGGALAGLRASFGGNPTEGERKILLDVQGIGAKSIEERAIILKDAYRAQQIALARHQKRLNEINQGLYRDTTGTPGTLQELP